MVDQPKTEDRHSSILLGIPYQTDNGVPIPEYGKMIDPILLTPGGTAKVKAGK
jgi:hypothetical protein